MDESWDGTVNRGWVGGWVAGWLCWWSKPVGWVVKVGWG